MRLLAFALLALLAGCGKRDERIDVTEHVLIYPGAPVVEMPGKTKEMTVMVRSVSEAKLTKLTLSVKSEACKATVSPASIAEINPGARKPFKVVLTRVEGKPRQRYPLELTLRGGGLPVAAGLDLQVDTSPPLKDGWIDVGQVKLVHQEQSRTVYYVLAGAPLLLLLGWLLWRFSRPDRGKKAA
jgi:hypothetical protein